MNKFLTGFIVLLIGATIAYAALTYTTDEIQTLLDAVNAKVSTSSGASDAGKMIVLDASGQLDASVAGAGSVTTVKSDGSQVGGADIETLDFDALFGITESPDTEINIDIADDGLDSQHYAAESIDPEHLNIANAEVDEYFLTYESDTSNFQWVAAPGGGDITTVGLCTTGDCTADFIDETDIADGDHGDFTYTGGAASIDDDVITIDEMGDSDHGDFSYATGDATLDADVVDSAEIADNAIDSEHYTDGSIDTAHYANNSITAAKMADGDHGDFTYATNSATLDADVVDSAEIADDAIDSEHYTDASIDLAHLSADSVDGTKIADDAIDSEHYTDGSIDTAHLAADVIDETKLADDSIDSEHYNDGSIDPAHLNFVAAPAAGNDEYAVTYEHGTGNFELTSMSAGGTLKAIYTETVQEGDSDIVSLDFDAPFSLAEAPDTYITIDIADDGIDSQHYAAASVDLEHLAADSVDGTKIADDAIDSEHYTDGSIDLAFMAADSVDGTKIADDAIDSEHYAAGSIDFEHMSANSIDSAQYVDGSIDGEHLAADIIDETKLADNSIDSEHYNDASIDLAHMSDDSVDSGQYVDASIDPEHLNFVVAPAAGSDEYAVTYEHGTGNFELVSMVAGGTLNTILESTVQEGGTDIVSLDFDDPFTVVEAPDTYITIDIEDDGLDSQHYAAGSVDLEHLAADSVDGTKIADDAIDSEHYTDASIDLAFLAADSVDGTKIADDAIDSEHYTDASIDLAHMSVNSIDSDQYVDGSIDLAHMSAESIDSDQYVDGSIDEPHINATNAPTDNYLLSYNLAGTNFTWVAATAGGTVNAIYSETVQEGNSDIVSLDFDAPFSVAEAPDTYITIDIADNGIDSQHYAAGSIDLEHMSAESVDSDQYVDASIDLAHMSDESIDSDQYVDASIDEPHLNVTNAPTDNYVLSYNLAGTNFTWVENSSAAALGVYDGGVQVGDTDIDKLDFDGTVFAITEPVNTDIAIDIADNGLDSQHYAADSIDNEHINWGDITHLDNDGVLVSLGGHVAVGAYELQSTTNVVAQLGDAAGTNYFEVQTSGGGTAFKVMSDGEVNPSATPGVEFTDSTHDAGGKISVNSTDANDAEMLLGVDDSSGDNTTYIDLDGVNERVDVEVPLTAPSMDAGKKHFNLTGTTSYDMDTEVPGICEGHFRLGGTAAAHHTVTLPDSGLCNGDSGSMKRFCFFNFDTTYELRIEPNDTTDSDIFLIGSAVYTSPNYTYSDTPNGAHRICLVAISVYQWIDESMTGTWTEEGS